MSTNAAKVDLIPFEVRSLSDRLTDVVRDFILSGEISPAVAIRQDALATRLKVSKIPLREALARLEQDGLVVSHPNRGYFVMPLSASEAEEVYALRVKIEPEAAAYACQKANQAEQKAAREALNLLDREAASQTSGVGSLHRAFHLAMVSPGERHITARMVMRLHVIADRYVRKHLEPLGRHVRAEVEHEEILAAWLKRQPDKVEKLIRQHLEFTLEDLRKQLSAAESGNPPVVQPKKSRKKAAK
jgi:DNA-binding GntR family transcriptional regulator